MTRPGRARRTSPPALSERRFHAWLVRRLPWGTTGPLPLGDDATALEPPPGQVAVVSVDAFVQGYHFLARTPADRIGHAAAAAGMSDLAAKGAEPRGILLAIVAPPGTPQRWAERLVVGAERAAATFGAQVVGGDTKPGATRTVVATALGWAPRARLVARSGARPGDTLVTTGTVGRGGALSRALSARDAPRERAVAALLDLSPRVREGRALRRFATAMLDTSDGLAESCRILAEASDVGLVVDEGRLPWYPRIARLPPPRRRTVAFYGGDYELLATIPPSRVGAARRSVERSGCPLTPIGTVVRGRGATLRLDGAAIPMPRGGWQPFG